MALDPITGVSVGSRILGGLGQLFGGESAASRARRIQGRADAQADEATRRMDATSYRRIGRATEQRYAPEDLNTLASDYDAINQGLSSGMAAARTYASGAGSGSLSRNLMSAGLDAARAKGEAGSRRYDRMMSQRRIANEMENEGFQMLERAPQFQASRLDRQAQAASEGANAMTDAGLTNINSSVSALGEALAYDKMLDKDKKTGGGFLDPGLVRRISSPISLRAEGGKVPGMGAGDRVMGESSEGEAIAMEPGETIVSKADEQFLMEPIGGALPSSARDVPQEAAAEIGYRMLEVLSKYTREANASEVRDEALAQESASGMPVDPAQMDAMLQANMGKGFAKGGKMSDIRIIRKRINQ